MYLYNFETGEFDLKNISQFSKEMSLYITGFVSPKLSTKIKYDICNGVKFGNKSNFFLFINMKNKGGLHYPNNNVVVQICIATE